MKLIGFLLILVAMVAIDHGGGITWGLIFMLLAGGICMFPNLLQYFFESEKSERK
jgi:hypothetical protein